MSVLHNVVLVGVSKTLNPESRMPADLNQATGLLGASIFSALRASHLSVTVLTRDGSKTRSLLHDDTHIITANYASHASLVAAFKGADVVVSAIGGMAVSIQPRLIDAAIEAGVKRFIPSEFGADTLNEKSRLLPVYHGKVATFDHLVEKSREGKIEWTAIIGGHFWISVRLIYPLQYSFVRGLNI
jgi:hypothetical protein